MAKPAALEGFEFEEPTAPAQPLPETSQELQAAVEGVPFGDSVEFLGERFKIADSVGLMPLMRFAYTAQRGTLSRDMEGLVAMYTLIRDCLADEKEWQRFQDHASAKKADEDQLLEFVSDTIELLTARPTQRPSDSSAGPLPTSGSSTESSSSPDTQDGPGLVLVSDLAKELGA